MLAQRIPGARLELVSEGTHGLTLEHAGELNALLREWLFQV